MKPVHVVILALLAVAAGAVAWYSSQGDKSAEAVERQLFPTLADNLDAVTRVALRDASGASVTLEQKDGDWVVKEKSSYLANRPQITELVLAASEARVVEAKTANAEYYERLGVRAISEADSTAVLLAISTDVKQFEVLMGNASERMGGSTFVRKPDAATSLLVAPALSGVADPDTWLDKAVVDIAADDVQSVRIVDGGKVTEISKQAMVGSDFDLAGRTEGELNKAAVNALGRGLTGLRFEDVMRGVAFAVNDFKRKDLSYTLFTGVIIDVTLFYREPEDQAESSEGPPPQAYWLSTSARFDEALAQELVPQPAAADGAKPKPFKLTSADLADRRAEVEQFNRTRKSWIYKISAARYKRLNQSDSSLVSTP